MLVKVGNPTQKTKRTSKKFLGHLLFPQLIFRYTMVRGIVMGGGQFSGEDDSDRSRRDGLREHFLIIHDTRFGRETSDRESFNSVTDS